MRVRLLAIGLGLSLGLSLVARAADSPLDKAEPAAAELFRSVSAAYKALPSYSDQGEFVRSLRVGGQVRVEKTPLSWKFTRPNRLVLEAGEVRVVGDGKTLTTVLMPTKRFLSTAAEPTLDPVTIADGPAGAILLGGAAGPPAQILLKLLAGVDPASAFPDRATTLKKEDDRVIDGRTFAVLKIEQGDEPALRVMIDPQTKLIHRMEYSLEAKTEGGKLPKSVGEIGDMAISWTSGEIHTEAIAETVFKFEAPAGFTRVKSAEAAKPAQAKKNEMIGQMAPDFTFTLLDGAGSTKKVTRDALKGKVVVIDFWATWCGPCLAELPEIQDLVDSYIDAKKTGVVFIAVSQDRNPEDGSTVRKLVEDLLKSKTIELDKAPLSRIALDPGQEIGDLFKVQALPTLVVLDAKGIVQSVRIGFSEDIKKSLGADIDTLLSGKSLIESRPAADDKK